MANFNLKSTMTKKFGEVFFVPDYQRMVEGKKKPYKLFLYDNTYAGEILTENMPPRDVVEAIVEETLNGVSVE